GETLEMKNGVRFAIEAYAPKFGSMGPAVQVSRVENGKASSFWVFENAPDFDKENRADRWALSFIGLEKQFFTGLQIAHDPGTKWVFLGCSLLLTGLLVAFYTVHRRLWARVEPGKLVLAGSTHKNAAAFERMFDGLRQAL